MKRFAFVLFPMVAVSGCISTTVTAGRAINAEAVAKIEKGKTTAAEVVALLGNPFVKEAASANEEKWLYYHSTLDVEYGAPKLSTHKLNTLSVFLRDGIVLNFVQNEGEVGTAVEVKSNDPVSTAR